MQSETGIKNRKWNKIFQKHKESEKRNTFETQCMLYIWLKHIGSAAIFKRKGKRWNVFNANQMIKERRKA